jgi:glycosyltransferase involved in cell wall biosynthesis
VTRELRPSLNNSYSIVIPAYNESKRLSATLDRVLAYVSRERLEAEIIVVNDGSSDNTAEIVRTYARENEAVRLVENPGNRGKGYSVRHGVLEARGTIILFSDADLSSPIEEMSKLVGAIKRGADIAIGSRWLRTELQTHRQSIARQAMGRAFNYLLRILLQLNFKDTQCGFKAFRRGAARAIFPLQKVEGWGFDPELLFLARRGGFKVVEVPVVWGHDAGTRIHPLADGSRMILEMLRIRWNAISGDYGDSASLRATVLAGNQRPRR